MPLRLPGGYSGRGGAQFENRPRAWCRQAWYNAGVSWAPPVTSYLDVFSLDFWLWPSAVCEFLLLVFLWFLAALSAFRLRSDRKLFPCSYRSPPARDPSEDGIFVGGADGGVGPREGGVYRAASLILATGISLFFKIRPLRWHQALPLPLPACPSCFHFPPPPSLQPWFISSVEPFSYLFHPLFLLRTHDLGPLKWVFRHFAECGQCSLEPS